MNSTKITLLTLSLLIPATIHCMDQDMTIHDAAWTGDITKVRELIGTRQELVNAHDIIRRTPLHLATISNHKKVALFLVQHGANVNATAHCTSGKYKTPLHCASLEGNSAIALILLQYGADINALDSHGRTPLDIAQKHHHAEVIQLLNDWPLYKIYVDRQLDNIEAFKITSAPILPWHLANYICNFIIPDYPRCLKSENPHTLEQIHCIAKQTQKPETWHVLRHKTVSYIIRNQLKLISIGTLGIWWIIKKL